jgi:putative Mg2+ transporter-C (MgtC) family protein
MELYTEDILKILLALALGGLIGAEREMRDKAAGFRTLMFICSGATLFTIFSLRFSQYTTGDLPGDPTRIAAQIVSGIGFLGAGVILREHGEIRGLTTASAIWLVAAIGVGVGGGQYLLATLATIIIVVVLWVFPSLERMMGTISQVHHYQVITPKDRDKYNALTDQFKHFGLQVMASRRVRRGENMICYWTAAGRPQNHKAMIDTLFEDPEISEFEV